jgi:hypothetical protein
LAALRAVVRKVPIRVSWEERNSADALRKMP